MSSERWDQQQLTQEYRKWGLSSWKNKPSKHSIDDW